MFLVTIKAALAYIILTPQPHP